VIGLDTNLLVRLVARDDEQQVSRVVDLLEQCRQQQDRCVVTLIALCELEWVLTISYQAPRTDVIAMVQALLDEEIFIVEHSNLVLTALGHYQRGSGDLSDYLLGERSRTFGVTTTYTFDKALRNHANFTLL
jgi:predicted nucleic-acid-binding protein